MTDPVSIRSDRLSAEISPLGAEVQSLRDADGRDLLWDGDPAWWTGHAPILFPIVGAVANDTIRVDGKPYSLPRHGFARRRSWALAAQHEAGVTFRLTDDPETHAVYPFAFVLELAYAIEEATLSLTATLTNPADTDLPASFGFHPALRWPLPYGAAKEEHRIVFALPEPAPIRRLDAAGLLRPTPEPAPIAGDTLAPEASLFEDDAMILDKLASRALTFGAPGTPGLAITFPEMSELGIWQKPGAPFLCIEPWAGHADPEGYAGEFRDKPGVVIVEPHGQRRFGMNIALTDAH